ncbi:hypothetical protein [Brevundimonas sp.]|uniref:hypothetical protein n=1 Tax=Brevundimonas sp. TaxID=1871086 RepID=UPI003BACE878
MVLQPYNRFTGDVSPYVQPLPPYGEIRVDIAAGTIEATTDFAGLARIYWYATEDLVIVTNHPIALAAAPRIGFQPDLFTFASVAGIGWALGDTTFDARVSHLRPSARLTAAVQPDNRLLVRFRDADPLKDILAGSGSLWDRARRWLTPAHAGLEARQAEAAKALSSVAGEIAAMAGDNFKIALTGGRDSRLLAALFLSSGARPRFNTTNLFEDETRVVQELLSRVGRLDDLKISEPMKRPRPTEGAYFERAMARALSTSGFAASADIGRGSAFKGLSGRPDGLLHISGAAGEMGHGHFYPKARKRFNTLPSTPDMIARLVAQLGYAAAGSETSVSLITDYIRTFFAIHSPTAQEPLHVLDRFYLYERFRRWSHSSISVVTAAPLAHIGFAAQTLRTASTDLRNNAFHHALIARWMPEWSDVRFFKGGGGVKTNTHSLSVETARSFVDYAASKPELAELIDWARLEHTLEHWDAEPRAKREALVKNALWLGTILDAFKSVAEEGRRRALATPQAE